MNAIEMALSTQYYSCRAPSAASFALLCKPRRAGTELLRHDIYRHTFILTLCFRMIHLQTACCGGNSATQEPHAAHTSHRNTMPDLAPRLRRASSQPQRMGTQVSGGKDESKIRMTTAAQEYLMGWHKNPTEAKRAHNLERW